LWIVEISAVSDLRPRGQWPQGHINADYVNLRAATGRVRAGFKTRFPGGGRPAIRLNIWMKRAN